MKARLLQAVPHERLTPTHPCVTLAHMRSPDIFYVPLSSRDPQSLAKQASAAADHGDANNPANAALSKLFLAQARNRIQDLSRSVRDSVALLDDPQLPGAKDLDRWWPEPPAPKAAASQLLVAPRPPAAVRIAPSSARSAADRPRGPEPERKPFRRPHSARGTEGNGESLNFASRGGGAKTVPRLAPKSSTAATAGGGHGASTSSRWRRC